MDTKGHFLLGGQAMSRRPSWIQCFTHIASMIVHALNEAWASAQR